MLNKYNSTDMLSKLEAKQAEVNLIITVGLVIISILVGYTC